MKLYRKGRNMEENSRVKIKQYNVKFYEIEIVFLYNLLVKSQPRMVRLEQQIKTLMQANPEFRAWDFFLKEKSSTT